MKQILQEISENLILLNEYDFTEEQLAAKWLGSAPASDEEINKVQDLLQIKLPQEYIDFLKISNGFHELSSVHPTLMPVSKIDYLINIDEDLVEIWGTHEELAHVARGLQESILIGGLGEEQYLLLIPPNDVEKQWRYWEFANWKQGEEEVASLTAYFTEVLEFLKKDTEGLTAPRPKPVIDYSLRDYVFAQDWDNVYTSAADLFLENITLPYYNGSFDPLKLLFVAAGKLNRYEELASLIYKARTTNEQYKLIAHILIPWEEAAKNKTNFVADAPFVIKKNPETIEQIEEQIRVNRPDLLREKSWKEKASYQLYFLYQGGNAPAFIQVYESQPEILLFDYEIKAAIVYATLHQPLKAKQALDRYFKEAFTYRPLAPFLYPVLMEILDNDFTNDILSKYKQ